MKKQFFAGTACPQCRELDKIRRCEDAAGVIWLECLACGYTQDLTEGYVNPDEDPHDHPEEEPAPAPVRWIPPATPRKP